MDEQNVSKQEGKPFSVLEKFRQLKKEKEQAPTSEESLETADTTVFQASGSSSSSQSNGDFGRGGFRSRGFGRFGGRRGKRNCYDNSTERPSKRIAADHLRGQKETDVGITEYVRSGPGFDVILKHRYTDFHVHEIDLDGNVIKLTSTEIPKITEEPVKPSTEENPQLLTPEQWTALKEIVDKQLTCTMDKDVTDLNKEERQKIHKAVKMRFGTHVYSNTNIVEGRKIMQIGYTTMKDTRFVRWPNCRPEYLHFVVHKENCETAEALHVIGKLTKVRVNKFGYAGTKDKRAVTTQQMCLRKVDMNRFNGCNNWRAITVGNFCYKWNNLRLGDLSGNRFKLVLRYVKASEEVITEAVESLKNVGFINYFGMQRFGQSALVPTYLVGQAILKGDWKLATELVLKPRPGEATFRDVMEAREAWWETRDATKALKHLSRNEKSIEGKILLGLRKHGPNAYQNAFDGIPHHTVTLYLHSYQSLVWNKVVSRRVQQFGLKVLPGDLVMMSVGREADLQAYRWQENAADDSSESEDDEDEGRDGCKIQVQVLSAEEAETASIYDVVYPLPGDDIRFPNNEIAEWYNEILEADGHSLNAFSKVNKKYGMYGTYRKMLEKVEDLNWSIQRYSDPDEDLLLSDIDIMKGKSLQVSDPDGPYKAIIIEFNLKTCSYATMAVRELAKCETSVVVQAKLTNQAREEYLAAKKVKTDESEKMEVETEVKCEQMTRTADNNCDLPRNNEVQDEKLVINKEIQEETINVKQGMELEGSVNYDSTQDGTKSGTKTQLDNLLDGKQSNMDLDNVSFKTEKEPQLENDNEHRAI